MNPIFKAKIVEQKALKGLRDRHIAEMIGYSVDAVRQVMCGCYPSNPEKIENAIAKALNIER